MSKTYQFIVELTTADDAVETDVRNSLAGLVRAGAGNGVDLVGVRSLTRVLRRRRVAAHRRVSKNGKTHDVPEHYRRVLT